jgi:hypothetical protein
VVTPCKKCLAVIFVPPNIPVSSFKWLHCPRGHRAASRWHAVAVRADTLDNQASVSVAAPVSIVVRWACAFTRYDNRIASRLLHYRFDVDLARPVLMETWEILPHPAIFEDRSFSSVVPKELNLRHLRRLGVGCIAR